MKQEDLNFNCDRCRHLRICILFKTLSAFIDQNFKTYSPIKPTELAKICKEYDTPLTDADVRVIAEP